MKINHITFVVKDLERSTSFFKDVFGAKEVYSSGDKTFSLSQEVFLTIDDLWVCIMKGEPSPKCGYNHIAFKIEEHEFDEYMERIENIGVEIKQGRSRVDGEGKSIYFYDFDNHLFELHTGTLADRLERYKQNTMLNYAVFASGSGSNLQALIDAQGSAIHNAKIALVLSTKSDAYSLTRAENAEIPTAVVPRSDTMEAEISALLNSHDIDFIVLAGWMTVLSAEFVSRWHNRIINTHPSLLPAFGGVGMYGMRVHEAVLAAGATTTGATVHYVNEVVDGGDIILQKSVAVEEGDTPVSLQKRVLEQCEWVILPQAVQIVAEKLTREKSC